MLGVCDDNMLSSRTGGQKRFRELYLYLKKSGVDVSCLKYPYFMDGLGGYSKKICMAFDERYLLYSLLYKLRGWEIVFCPRGNKIEHQKYKYSRLRLILYRKVLGLLYRLCDKGIFQTVAQKNEFIRVYRWRRASSIVPNNVSASWMQPLLRSRGERPIKKNKYIGFFGGDNPRKGYDLMISAYCMARDKGYDNMLIVGGQVNEHKQKTTCAGIRYAGWLDDITQFYSKIHLVVIPSIYDSFPNVLLEAIASGVPVIMSKNEISEELCAGMDIMLFDHNSTELANKLLLIEKSDDYYSYLLDAANCLLKKYSFCWGQKMLKEIIGEK